MNIANKFFMVYCARNIYSSLTWHEYNLFLYPVPIYDAGGGFFNVNNIHPWTKKDYGGCAGTYYEWNIQYDPHANAEWATVIPGGMRGFYALYMYWNKSDSNSETSYYYMH